MSRMCVKQTSLENGIVDGRPRRKSRRHKDVELNQAAIQFREYAITYSWLVESVKIR